MDMAGIVGYKRACSSVSRFLLCLVHHAKNLDMVGVEPVFLATVWLPMAKDITESNGNALVSEQWQAFLLFGSSLLCIALIIPYTLYYFPSLSSICD